MARGTAAVPAAASAALLFAATVVVAASAAGPVPPFNASAPTCQGRIAGIYKSVAESGGIRMGFPTIVEVTRSGDVLVGSEPTVVLVEPSGLVQRVVGGEAGGISFSDVARSPTGARATSIAGSAAVPRAGAPSTPYADHTFVVASCALFRVGPEGWVTHVGGTPGTCGFAGDGGDAKLATFSSISSFVVHPSGDLFVQDTWNSVTRRNDAATGIVTRWAGTGTIYYPLIAPLQRSAAGLATDLNYAWGIDVDPIDNALVIADTWNHVVRKCPYTKAPAVFCTIIAGSGTRGYSGDGGPALAADLNVPRSVAHAPNGDLVIADTDNTCIRRVSRVTGIITTVAGLCGSGGFVDGPLGTNRISGAWGVDVSPDGSIYVADSGNEAIRMVSAMTGNMTTLSKSRQADGGAAKKEAAPTEQTLSVTAPAVLRNGDIVFADGSSLLRRINATSGRLTVIAGAPGEKSGGGDGGPSELARLSYPAFTVVGGPNGDIYLADAGNGAIRRISVATGVITTVAGSRGSFVPSSPSDDGKRALDVPLNNPCGVDVAPDGTLYVADSWNGLVRQVKPDGTVYTVLGVPGGPSDRFGVFNGVTDGPARNATLFSPEGVRLSPKTGILYVLERGAHIVRGVNLASRTTFLVAGTPTVAGFSGDGGPAVNAMLNLPSSLTITREGDLLVADTHNHAIRLINTTTGIISTFMGKGGRAGYNGEDGAPQDTLLNLPNGVTVGPNGEVYVSDSGNAIIRVLGYGAPTRCPPGFYCTCGLNPRPCTSPDSYCPRDSSAPVPTDPGYEALSTSAAWDSSAVLYHSQRHCPLGSYCKDGRAYPCPGGAYGVRMRATSPLSCKTCQRGSYLAESGRFSPYVPTAAVPASPCQPCPAGSVSSTDGATSCRYCGPGTYAARVGGDRDSACVPCPKGTTSLFGSPACFATSTTTPEDGISLVGRTISFQRILPVKSGAAPSAEVQGSIVQATVPIFILFLVPTLVLWATWPTRPGRGGGSGGRSCCFCCTPAVRAAVHVRLADMDQYGLKSPEAYGESPVNRPTAAGGACSITAMGVVLALMVSTVIEYDRMNVLLQQSVLPVTLATLSSFIDLPPAPLLEPVDTPQLAPAGRGLTVTLTTMGARCGALVSYSSSLLSGAFEHNVTSDASTGAALHVFQCPSCVPDGQSTLTARLEGSCQTFVVTVAGVTVGGGLTAASYYASSGAGSNAIVAVSATVPLALEVIQDTTPKGGDPREEDGLYVGGRSARGFLALSTTGMSQVEGADPDNTGGAVDVTVYLPLVSTYTRYELSQKMTLLQLFSSLVAWAGLVGAGVHLLTLHDLAMEKLGLASEQQVGGGMAVLAAAPPKRLEDDNEPDSGKLAKAGVGGGGGGGARTTTTANPLTGTAQQSSMRETLRATFVPVSHGGGGGGGGGDSSERW